MRQVLYTMFVSNNLASFQFWWKENLVKHQKVSKYYEDDCRFITEIVMLKHSSQYRKAVSCEATPKIPLTFACIVVAYVMGDNFMEMGGEGGGGRYLRSFWNLICFLARLESLIFCSGTLYKKVANCWFTQKSFIIKNHFSFSSFSK